VFISEATKGAYDTTRGGKAINYLHAGLAEDERDRIKDRTYTGKFKAAKNENRAVVGKMPFGRLYDKKTRQWSIDKSKQEMIQDVATRYLAGEGLIQLATEYGVNHANLHKILMKRSGSQWENCFNDPEVPDANGKIILTIPPLLDDRTIEKVRAKAKKNKTWAARATKQTYLLGGLVRCDACGYTMNGQKNHNGHRYYRHGNRDGATLCELSPRPWVRADELEDAVLEYLIDFYGNPVAVQKAIEAAHAGGDV
jgi:hypothetical protein